MPSLLTSVIALGAAVALFALLYRLVRYETVHGRLALRGVRNWIDDVLDGVSRAAARALARGAAALTRRPTTPDANVSSLMRHATHTPLTVTHTDNHLSKMREHKTETTLTPAQQRKLRKQKLEERF